MYDSHRPQSVKRGIIKCLYDWAKRRVTKSSVISLIRFLYIKGCIRIVYICKNKQNFLCLTALLQLLLYGSDQVQSKLLTLRLHGVSKSDFSVFFWKGNLFEQKALFLMDNGIVVIQILTAGYPLGNELVLALIFIYFKRFYPIFYLSLFCLSSFSF